MGGNALQVESVRLAAPRYHTVARQVVQRLHQAFPDRRIESVLAFAQKPDFGDLDLLIEGGTGYDPGIIAAALEATEVARNGDVTSIGIDVDEGVFQVDLIQIPAASFDFAARYFGFNDMGNLLGRIAHKFGAKFGHLGLLYPMRDPENASHLIAELPITTDFGLALRLLGFDAARYEDLRQHGGFQTLLDIFQYVVSSPYVNSDIYLLENRNHASRIRDAKRPTYNAFLTWLDAQPDASLPAYPWASAEREQQQQAFLDAAFAACPAFQQAFDQARVGLARKKALKRRYNGQLASAVTGLSGKALGELMMKVRHSFSDEAAFEAFFIDGGDEAIKACFLAHA
jgi:hypothetical protein